MADYLRVCELAARAGAAVLVNWVGRFEVWEKGPSDLVSEADLASQEAIRGVILLEFPRHGFISEEGHDALDPALEYCWVVDPLDGTTNFVHRLPHYAVSVALLHRGRPIVGAVVDPLHDECFTCERGSGAFLNGKPIHTSNVEQLSGALATASFAAHVEPGSREIDQFVAAVLQCQAVRRTGSAALNLCYLAAGRVDAFWARSTHLWDIAAGALLVEEAGGVVTGLEGQPLDWRMPYPVATANATLQRHFLRLLEQAPHLS